MPVIPNNQTVVAGKMSERANNATGIKLILPTWFHLSTQSSLSEVGRDVPKNNEGVFRRDLIIPVDSTNLLMSVLSNHPDNSFSILANVTTLIVGPFPSEKSDNNLVS